jgi:hypothetical protein
MKNIRNRPIEHTRLKLAEDLVAYYNLSNKVIMSCQLEPDTLAFFNFDTGNIELCNTRTPSIEQFILSVLHEIGHAIDAENSGLQEFDNMYNTHVTELESNRQNSYTNNQFELSAEIFANDEFSKIINDEKFKNWIDNIPVSSKTEFNENGHQTFISIHENESDIISTSTLVNF